LGSSSAVGTSGDDGAGAAWWRRAEVERARNGNEIVGCDFRHLEQMANGRMDCEAAAMMDNECACME
jgi:hypothetical protein